MSPCSWTDLVVGAPNFFDRKAEIGGAVYVFLNPASHWEKARPIRLNGTYDSMFGMTISSTGDLDRDGYDGKNDIKRFSILCMFLCSVVNGNKSH